MRTSDLLAMCIRNLMRRKFRTFLTVTGVVIGTTLIIMVISLTIGQRIQQEEQLKQWGDLSIIEVWYGGGGDSDIALDDEALKNILAIEGVDVATPFMRLQINAEPAVYAGKSQQYRLRYPEIIGVFPEALEKMGFKIDKGESLSAAGSKKIKAVFGGNTVYNFEDTRKKVNNMRNPWPDESGKIEEPFFDPLTADYTLSLPPSNDNDGSAKKLEYDIEISGVLVGERNKWESMYSIFMPLEDVQKLQAEYNKENGIKTDKKHKVSYDNVRVKALDLKQISEIEKQIQGLGFGTWSMETQRQEVMKSIIIQQIIYGSIGGITLLVSAISITNTMIMSVYERTREIGVMKVLGCLVGNIYAIFLLEAAFIGFFGGVIGTGLSFLVSYVLNAFGGAVSGGGRMFGGMMGGMMGGGGGGASVSVIPPWLVLLGVSFATVIGLVAGFYPAYRAVKISALEAIKQE